MQEASECSPTRAILFLPLPYQHLDGRTGMLTKKIFTLCSAPNAIVYQLGDTCLLYE